MAGRSKKSRAAAEETLLEQTGTLLSLRTNEVLEHMLAEHFELLEKVEQGLRRTTRASAARRALVHGLRKDIRSLREELGLPVKDD